MQIVVNVFGFLVITRSPVVGFGRNLEETNRNSLPELSKQPRTLRNEQKMQKTDEEMSRKKRNVNDYLHLSIVMFCDVFP